MSSAPPAARQPDLAPAPASALCVDAVIIDAGRRLTVLTGPEPTNEGLVVTCAYGQSNPRTVTRTYGPDDTVMVDRDNSPACERCGVRGWVSLWNGGTEPCKACDGTGRLVAPAEARTPEEA